MPKKNPREYYYFHKSTGHATKGCRALRDHIEELLGQRHYWEFVKDKARKENSVKPMDRDWSDKHIEYEDR